MSYCKKCGIKAESHAKFCQNCGDALVDTTTKTSIDENIKVATTSVTTVKAFTAVGNSLSFVLNLLKKLIKPAIILSILGVLIFGLVFGGFMFYENNLKKDKEQTIQQIEQAIQSAQKNASSKNEKWEVFGVPDPASGKNIARYAYIISNDGLCSLFVEQRINGDDLTSVGCDKFNIDSHSGISIKFDIDKNLYTMDVVKFSDSDDIYFPSNQATTYKNSYNDMNKGYLPYEKYIEGLLTASTLAVKITPTFNNEYDDFENPFRYKYNREEIKLKSFWIKFSLKNARSAISKLGKVIPVSEGKTHK